MTATILPFPARPTLLSTVHLTRLDGAPFRSAGFLPSEPGAAWSWIQRVVCAELECLQEQVGTADHDTVTVDGLPVYMVEIVRPACFACN